ncbi:MAG: hypothetical protein Ct9H300mP24_4480 [Candidatus Neomarinimicrobiota bacterium]|nr:MAG: hypothetical protein Ct9H300mP24_4480 [Candidatus Neomarinimicrobiota bacterium]
MDKMVKVDLGKDSYNISIGNSFVDSIKTKLKNPILNVFLSHKRLFIMPLKTNFPH